jgi:hypothetical protein
MVAPEVQGIDLFKITNRSISGWVPSFKMGSASGQDGQCSASALPIYFSLLDYAPCGSTLMREDPGTPQSFHVLPLSSPYHSKLLVREPEACIFLAS